MIKLWRGSHSYQLLDTLKQTLRDEQLLILIPPLLRDFSFLAHLPETQAELLGDWDESSKKSVELHCRFISEAQIKWTPTTEWALSKKPVIGVFTSGTITGIPRLVLYSKNNMTSSLKSIRQLFDVSKIKTIFCFPQPTHTFGLVLGYVHAALYDHELIIHEGKYSKSTQDLWFSRVNSQTVTLGAPAHFYDLISRTRSEDLKVPSSYASICGGAPVDVGLWKSMQDILHITNPSIGYGATEAAPGVMHLRPGLEPKESGEVGEPLFGVSVRIIDGKGIEFSGENVCLAYIESNKVEYPNSILLKDNIIKRHSDGMYLYRGRYELEINRGGQKLSLESIEDFLRREFSLNAIAVALPDERLGQELGLLMESTQHSVESLKQSLASRFGVKWEGATILETASLPLSPNFKPDRKLALEILMSSKLTLPVSVTMLSSWLPHRPPAVWVDEVVEANPEYGVCKVILKKHANYFAKQTIRSTSYVEWMAQSYAYVRAYQGLTNLVPQTGKPEKAFLVALKDIEIPMTNHAPHEGDSLFVKVKKTHELGPLSLVEGEVRDASGNILCKGQLKLFAQ